MLGGFASYEFYQTPSEVTWGADIGISTQVTGDAFDRGSICRGRPAGQCAQWSVGRRLWLRDRFRRFGRAYAVDDRLNVATRIGVIYASDDYMQTHFGVGTAQAVSAAALGNPIGPLDADAGIKNVYLNVNATYELTDNIQLRAGVGYSRLLNDAADSPITENETQFSGTIGAAYRIRF